MNSEHEPFVISNKNARKTILYIHGVMGSPIEFKQLVELTNFPNMNYRALLLPGHGGSGYQFVSHKAKDWRAYVFKEIDYHFHNGEDIFLIGHSLGGLLALQAATKYPISGMILINTAMRTRLTLRQMVLSVKVLFAPKNSVDPIISTYRKTFSVSTHDWWTIPLWILRLTDVMLIAKQTEKVLPDVQSKIHLFQSVLDETVNPISAKIMEENLQKSNVQLTFLPNSLHAHFENKDLMLLIGGIKQMVNEVESLKVVN